MAKVNSCVCRHQASLEKRETSVTNLCSRNTAGDRSTEDRGSIGGWGLTLSAGAEDGWALTRRGWEEPPAPWSLAT